MGTQNSAPQTTTDYKLEENKKRIKNPSPLRRPQETLSALVLGAQWTGHHAPDDLQSQLVLMQFAA